MVFESNREDCFLLLFPVLILIHHKQQALNNVCWYGYVNYNFLSFHLVWYSFLKVFAALDGGIDYLVWSRKSALQGSIRPHCGRVDWWILAKALWPVAPSGQRSSEVNDDWHGASLSILSLNWSRKHAGEVKTSTVVEVTIQGWSTRCSSTNQPITGL